MKHYLLLLLLLLVACGGDPSTVPSVLAPDVTPSVAELPVALVLLAGQSNTTGKAGDAVPAGMPRGDVRYWPTIIGSATQSTAFRALGPVEDGTHGAELQLGERLREAGRDVVIIKVSRNGSRIAEWLDSSPKGYGPVLEEQVLEARDAIARDLPGRAIEAHFVWDQGEAESQAPLLPPASTWARDYGRLAAQVEAVLGPFTGHVVRINRALPDAPHLELVREQQAQACTRLIDADDLPTLPDGVHRTGAAENTVGDRIAESILGAP